MAGLAVSGGRSEFPVVPVEATLVKAVLGWGAGASAVEVMHMKLYMRASKRRTTCTAGSARQAEDVLVRSSDSWVMLSESSKVG